MAPAKKRVHAKSRYALIALGLGVLMLGSAVMSPGARAETLGIHGDWTAFKTAEGGAPLCYIGSEPKKAEGDYEQRGANYVLVSQRPKAKEFDVVSVRAGYKYRQGSEVTVKIGGKTIKMFTVEGMAWAHDSKTDATLVKTMKAGAKMVIKGTSWRGTLTTDTYSLKGFTAAYNASRKACGLN